MHATTEQLLSIRDGEAVAADVLDHVASCVHCAAEVEHLHGMRRALRDLPPVVPDRGLWQTVAVQSVGRRSRAFPWVQAVGFAASFLVALIVLTRADILATPRAPAVATLPENDVFESLPLPTDAMQESRQLEAVLRAMPPRAITRAGTVRTLDDLEARIRWVDMQLSQADRLGLTPREQQLLWRQRVELMRSLVQVHYSQSGDVGL